MPATVAHSHRPTTKVNNKPFKSTKGASKHELRDRAKGRVPNEKGQRKTPHQQVMSKFDRRNQAKQARLTKHKEHLKDISIFSGKHGAPRVVAVVPLCADGDARAAVQQLNGSLDVDDGPSMFGGVQQVSVDRFKQRLQYITLERNLNACLDAARVADFVVVILSATVEVDGLGELILRSIESQGLSTLFTVVQGLDRVEPAKQRPGVVGSLKSFITHFHPEQEKIYSVDSRQDCANMMRSLCSTNPKGVRWREDRSWLLAESVAFASSESESTVITGVVRGRGLKADRLVQIGDWGAFQIEKITSAPLPKHSSKRKGDDMTPGEEAGDEKTLEEPTGDRDDLHELAPDDVVMDADDGDDAMSEEPAAKKGVLLDEHHYFSDGDEEEKKEAATRRLPKGTSKYQSAWYLEDVSDSGSDVEDMEMGDDDGDGDEDEDEEEEEARPEDGIEGFAQPEPTEIGQSEYPQSEMMEPDEEDDAAQLALYRAKKLNEAEEDKEFPDEIELLPNMLARERLSRYRGLKSLRSSPWQEDEDRAHEPAEWRRLLQVADYAASRSQATREALVGGVEPGTRVRVHVRGVPASVAQSHEGARAPVTLFSLLRHENKRTAVNYLINLSSDHAHSIKSKEELVAQCGARRMVIKPLFSQAGTTPNDVHKYCRYLHPGQSAIATFMGPVTWGSVPVLFFKRTAPSDPSDPSNLSARGDDEGGDDVGLTLVGTGTALPPSTSRVVAKRVILTGHPFHIHKKIVTVRYMFFNREDVEWFKAMPLWTKRGRSGFIKEPLGTHGYFKANFDGRINPQDAVGVSLYKRVWPRNAVPLRGDLLDTRGVGEKGGEDVDGDAMME
ncbi:Ribosome biogenesis protein tsr1 -like protein [Escovopsis weberi]|uniref:Ribosome biogenesis protein tsr1-like protein n=1 Tax=Escovopsis weberi TaxID=150374 RepID=A0A0M9VTU4_ESCWE|nr:Ribosome biogenesis protein tsr1 -like protein [Escovopsis weberi]